MKFLAPELSFDRNNPFHSLVVVCLAQSHGILDLASRGMNERFKTEFGNSEEKINQVCEGITEESREQVRSVLSNFPLPLPGVHRLKSVFDDGPKVDTELLGLEIVSAPKEPLASFNRMSAGSLLLMAWELTKDRNSKKKEPLWQFLYHCRNAVAHKGHFKFLNGEPKRKSEWRSLNIVDSLEGTPLFKDESGNGLLCPGDAMYLLADIEKQYY